MLAPRGQAPAASRRLDDPIFLIGRRMEEGEGSVLAAARGAKILNEIPKPSIYMGRNLADSESTSCGAMGGGTTGGPCGSIGSGATGLG